MAPKTKDMIHQFTALLPFVCARAALIRDKVNQPTAYTRACAKSDHEVKPLAFLKIWFYTDFVRSASKDSYPPNTQQFLAHIWPKRSWQKRCSQKCRQRIYLQRETQAAVGYFGA